MSFVKIGFASAYFPFSQRAIVFLYSASSARMAGLSISMVTQSFSMLTFGLYGP
jgi:hypothetical protein